MNKITKIGFSLPLLLGLLLIVTMLACQEAKTTADAPDSTNTNGQVSTTADTPNSNNTNEQVSTETNGDKPQNDAQNDAQSETRRKQLNADIQAREQRNNMAGDPQKRAEGDLASEVRSKLEANIPGGNLTVAANKTEVIVSGFVLNQEQLNKIKPLAMEIKGVRSVVVKAAVQL